MKKKHYIIPTTTLCHLNLAESITDDTIIKTSQANVIGEGGGELNAKEVSLVDDDTDVIDEDLIYKPYNPDFLPAVGNDLTSHW